MVVPDRGSILSFFRFPCRNFIGIIYIVGACLWSALAAYSIWCMKDVSTPWVIERKSKPIILIV